MWCDVSPLQSVYGHEKEGIIYAWILHLWIVNRELAQPFWIPICVYLPSLRDEMKHDDVFMSPVVNHILELYKSPEIIRFKSDNCGAQYKVGI